MTCTLGKILSLILVISLFVGCYSDQSDKGKNEGSGSANSKAAKEALIEANKHAVKAENEQIDNLITRYGWEMEETGTGLRYMILKKGEGASPKEGDKVFLDYKIKLITGDLIYSSGETGPIKFEVGKAEISGLDEAVRLLNEGDIATLIIPSYLAYGLIGDGNKINHKATLIYDVELTSVKKKD